ncbi:MAG: nitrilase-related carbon-nitrogen hydrolase [Polyangiaceae bacterium]
MGVAPGGSELPADSSPAGATPIGVGLLRIVGASAALAIGIEPAWGAIGPLGPIAHGVAALFGLAPWLWITRGAEPRRAFALGFAVGSIAAAIVLRFLPSAVVARGALNPAAAAVAFAAFAAMHGVWLGGASLIGAVLEARGGPRWLGAVLGAALLERLLPSPLPFTVGAGLVELPFIAQVADLGGPAALTVLAGLAAAAVAEPSRAARRLGAGAIGVAAIYGALRGRELDGAARSAPRLEVALVQGGIGEARTSEGADIVVIGESALPGRLPERELDALLPALLGAGSPLLFGATLQRERAGDLNVALLADREGHVAGSYAKRALLPFGERKLFGLGASGATYVAGERAPAMALAGTPIAVVICSEDLDEDRVAGAVRETRGEVVFDLANDAWFAGSSGAALHVSMARVRAIETGRYVVRASLGGPSVVVDPRGRVVPALEEGARGSTVRTVPRLAGGTVYGAVGSRAMISIALGVVLAGAWWASRWRRSFTERACLERGRSGAVARID